MRLHKYAGKEQGAMLIGSATELRELSTNLLSALQGLPERSDSDWPPTLFCRDISETDGGKETDFEFSIHLETVSASKPSPNLRSKIAFPILAVTVAIALWQLISWFRAIVA